VKTEVLGENFVSLLLYPAQIAQQLPWSEFGPQQCETGDCPHEWKCSPAFGRHAI